MYTIRSAGNLCDHQQKWTWESPAPPGVSEHALLPEWQPDSLFSVPQSGAETRVTGLSAQHLLHAPAQRSAEPEGFLSQPADSAHTLKL